MAFLFRKFQEGVKVLAKSPTFAKDGRHLQFQADTKRLFLYTRPGLGKNYPTIITSYNRLGKNADEADADEIIDMASKASLEEQQKVVQDNIHTQMNNFCTCMDDILLPDPKTAERPDSPSEVSSSPRRSGLGLAIAIGKSAPLYENSGE